MATKLNDGLIGFTRERIGMRAPTRPLVSAGTLTEASIHHGGEVGPPPMTFREAQRTVLAWQRFHQVDRGWNDIGYNLLVDGLGRVYQGRPVGKLPAAVGNHNTGMVGICFIMDGDRHKLNAKQRRTLKILFEEGIPKWGLPPLKTLEVKGHKEYSGHLSNACPGAHIMRHLKWRRGRY